MMKEYENIKLEVCEDTTRRKEDIAFYIEHGYMPGWMLAYRVESDEGLHKYSTDTRWDQYSKGLINRDKAVELAIKRTFNKIDKGLTEKLDKLDTIARSEELKSISIEVIWIYSRMYGSWCPRARVSTYEGVFGGYASGCGYDKESTAISTALNQSHAVLKILCDYKESALARGESDTSATAASGHDNRSILGYGAGYAAIPYFESGVGVNSFWSILKKCGYEVESHCLKRVHVYTIRKGV